jgi:hypothetical protein
LGKKPVSEERRTTGMRKIEDRVKNVISHMFWFIKGKAVISCGKI